MLRGRANAQNASFKISLLWPIHIINMAADKYMEVTISTDPKLANDIFIFFPAVNWLTGGFEVVLQKQFLSVVANLSK